MKSTAMTNAHCVLFLIKKKKKQQRDQDSKLIVEQYIILGECVYLLQSLAALIKPC